jgi:hypothetical protein
MKDILTPKFNAARPLIWQEMKVGQRKKADGTINLWQGGQLIGVKPALHPKLSAFIDSGKELLHRHREDARLPMLRVDPASVVTSKPAICGHFKTGH